MAQYNYIPDELKTLKQWVCALKDSKVPMRAFEYAPASSTDPGTWSDFDTAFAAVSEGHYDYCGFVFADNGIVGIDIDTGYDDDGFITPLAADVIGHCRSYTEKSRSGRGFHILLRGTLPFKGRNNLAGLEIYKAARYFIMTGNVLIYHDIEHNQEAIDYVVDTYFKQAVKENSTEITARIYSPVWQSPENGRIRIKPVYPRIPAGSRNICLTSLAGSLHSQGYSKRQIYDELIYANTAACDPPLSDRELQTICSSITRYKR